MAAETQDANRPLTNKYRILRNRQSSWENVSATGRLRSRPDDGGTGIPPEGGRALLVRLEAEVRRRLETTPACHDWDHTHRVRVNARQLLRAEGADPLVVEAAALLHDLGRAAEMNDQGKTCHAELGARLVPEVLRDLGVTGRGLYPAGGRLRAHTPVPCPLRRARQPGSESGL